MDQVATLTALEPGWLDGDGPAYDPMQLGWLAERLGKVVRRYELPTPYVYPTPEGHVQVEWSGAWCEVAAVVDLMARDARLLVVSLDSTATVERTVALNDSGADDELGRLLPGSRLGDDDLIFAGPAPRIVVADLDVIVADG